MTQRVECRWPHCECPGIHELVAQIEEMAERVGGVFYVDRERLSGTPICKRHDDGEATCPECGNDLRDPHSLHCSRRVEPATSLEDKT